MKNFKLGRSNGDFYPFSGVFNGFKFKGVLKDGLFGIEVTHLTLGGIDWNKYDGSEMTAEMEVLRQNVLNKVRKFGGHR